MLYNFTDLFNQMLDQRVLQSVNGIIVAVKGFSVNSCQLGQIFYGDVGNVILISQLLKGIYNRVFGADRAKICGGNFLHNITLHKRNKNRHCVTYATMKWKMTIVEKDVIYYTIHKGKKQHEIHIVGAFPVRKERDL